MEVVMQRVRKPRHNERADVNLTPMDDVVFLVLVFFVFTTKPMDLMGMMSAKSASPSVDTMPSLVELDIEVRPNDYRANGKALSLVELDALFAKTSPFIEDKLVAIHCDPESRHERLVSALNLCERYGIHKITLLKRAQE
jgi:biopolymer transport protein ExbD